jgi:signal transduction histidine kinase
VLSRLSIRWRLALGSALLTLVILLGFAVVVGVLTTKRIEQDFDVHVSQGESELISLVQRHASFDARTGAFDLPAERLAAFASADHALVRVTGPDGTTLLFPDEDSADDSEPDFGYVRTNQTLEIAGYRIISRYVPLREGTYSVTALYGRRLSEVSGTQDRLRFLLGVGVLGGALLALCAGLLIARNAMRPVTRLTATAREVTRTRDPDRTVPVPHAEDEVAELAGTLNEMLAALAESRAETEAMLARQRQFVADASHELRTPLTSVLANLELLADALDGEHGEAAQSALRSSRRMRRLVADLLLLARADVGREARRAPTDLAQVVVEAAAELEPVAGDHVIEVDARPALVDGSRDDLHRLALNLMENALRHTPPGTHVSASVARVNGDVRLVVADDGPGIAPELRDRIFERFVRGKGDRGGSFGLGLAIVRAVTRSHGGSVTIDDAPGGGARFTVSLPAE